MEDNAIKLFGFEIKRSKSEKDLEKVKSPVPPTDDDGAGYVTTSPGHYYGHYIDMSGGKDAKDNIELIKKYRNVATQPEADQAIEEVCNEALATGDNIVPVQLNLEKLKLSEAVKNKISTEFDEILSMVNFRELGHDMFRSWYVDGRMYHHLIVDDKNTRQGIKEIRYIDSTKIRKVKHIKYKTEEKTGIKLVDKVEEFYLFDNEAGKKRNVSAGTSTAQQGIKISTDSISYITSGLLDESRTKVISYLHKSIKPVNQLRMMEDSLVIYRLARAPERRIFYIDVGNLPRGKAEAYMKDIMARYRNKLVYDANTGQVKDDRKHMSMLEDFWLPRKEGGRGTEISTLPGGSNLGEIEDILYFQKQVYRALNVPADRLEQQSTYALGRSTEIQRDEVKFQRFIDRLRTRFSRFFLEILQKQLILKGVITKDDWGNIKDEILIDYEKDNHFTELKNIEMMRERMNLVDQAAQYIGQLYSKEYVMRDILKLTEEEIKDMEKEMQGEGPISDPALPQAQAELPQPEEPPSQQQEDFDPINEELQDLNLDMMKAVTTYLKS